MTTATIDLTKFPAATLGLVKGAYQRACDEGRMVVMPDGSSWSFKTPALARARVDAGEVRLATAIVFK